MSDCGVIYGCTGWDEQQPTVAPAVSREQFSGATSPPIHILQDTKGTFEFHKYLCNVMHEKYGVAMLMYVRLLHPAWAHDLINQLAKNPIMFACHLFCKTQWRIQDLRKGGAKPIARQAHAQNF